jgi:two-component system, LuxR family, sensor kinase FixL
MQGCEPEARPDPSDELARRVIESAGIGAWTYDILKGEFIASAVARSLLGVADAHFLDEAFLNEIVYQDDRAAARDAMARAIAGASDLDLQLRIPRDGAKHWVRLLGGAIKGADGSVVGLSGFIVDIDEQKRVEGSLRERDEHLRSILETAPDGMVVIAESGIMQSFSRAAERMFGYSQSEAIGKNVSLLMGEPDRTLHDDYLARYLGTGEQRIIGIGRIVTGQRKNGSTFPMHLSIGEMNAMGRRLFTGFVHDLTDERRTQGRLQQLQSELAHISRLSAMGEMGSALAHELNQPLAAISNYMKGSRRLLESVGGPQAAKIEAALDKAAEQAIRAGQIIRRLRDFVSRRESEQRVENLTKLIEEASALGLVGAREQGVQLKFEFVSAGDFVLADRVQLQQVLVNLFRNALDAMAESPRRELTVRTRHLAGGMIEIEVSDTGLGFAEHAESRLFQPFFTTKEAGMGVGLSISRTIVEAHGGQMRARTNESGGATFRFTLPVVAIEERAHAG